MSASASNACSTRLRTRRYPAFHVVAKPVGSLCNLDCQYCYYLEKEQLYAGRSLRMPTKVLESFIAQYIAGQQSTDVHFLWQGGEPTLLGVDYFSQIVRLQEQYARGKRIHNALQTNGTLLDDRWCDFLKAHDFLVGISIDGPADLHDPYRTTKGGRSSHAEVVSAIELMCRFQIEFNVLTAVHPLNVLYPLRVYEFLKSVGAKYMQFMPVVERWTENTKSLATADQPRASVTQWSVDSAAYGQFLIAIFDHWARHDVGRVFVQLFDTALESWLGLEPSLCLFRETCGNALAVEHNGDVYSCDHFVFPEYARGNLMRQELVQIVESPEQLRFGADKRDRLPGQCRRCDVLFACRGECPKNRFAVSVDGEPGLNYLCPSYLAFFRHIDPVMQQMAKLTTLNRSPPP